MNYIIELVDITKRFPGIVANDHISLQLKDREIHAILGENGAGKSTLMSILFGLYQPDEGHIKVRGQPVTISSPLVATDLGIGMVHQHFKLVPNFTVTENIMLGYESKEVNWKTLLSPTNREVARQKVIELSKKYHLNVDPDAIVETISVGMQQRVEILKMLYRQAEILVFDEPTAVLTPQEITELMHILKVLIQEGKSIFLITHKLKEIKMVADRCSIIRRGKLIETVDVETTSLEKMATAMVGRTLSSTLEKKPYQPGKVILNVQHLKVRNSRKTLAVNNLSMIVKTGEIVGIAGVDGNGQQELVEAITGLRPVDSGTIEFQGHNITRASIRKRTEIGLGHIPEDRQKFGLILDFLMYENMVLEIYHHTPYSNQYGLLNWNEIQTYGDRLMTQFDVRSGKGGQGMARTLSGGNQQKAIVAREIDRSPSLLIAFQPTRGLDIGAIEYIHKRLIAARDSGMAVLLVSFELDEIMELSDRILIIHNGDIIGERLAQRVNEEEVGLMMAGIVPQSQGGPTV